MIFLLNCGHFPGRHGRRKADAGSEAGGGGGEREQNGRIATFPNPQTIDEGIGSIMTRRKEKRGNMETLAAFSF